MSAPTGYCVEFLEARAKAYDMQADAYDAFAVAEDIYGSPEIATHRRNLAIDYRQMAASTRTEALELKRRSHKATCTCCGACDLTITVDDWGTWLFTACPNCNRAALSISDDYKESMT